MPDLKTILVGLSIFITLIACSACAGAILWLLCAPKRYGVHEEEQTKAPVSGESATVAH